MNLSDPFDISELKFYPVAVKDGKGLVATYVDARAVMDRLDAAVGPGNWQTTHRVIDPVDKAVECTLSIRFDGEWVSRSDIGYPNEAKDADNADKEPWKAAYSDSLKRAAVQFGVARYIYSIELERNWLPVDANKRFTEQPRIKGATQQAPTAARGRSAPEDATSAPRNPAAPPPAEKPTLWDILTNEYGFTPDEIERTSQEMFKLRPFNNLTLAEKGELYVEMQKRNLEKRGAA